MLGAITARAEAQVMRLASVYAALDGSAVIEVEHLHAGPAVWDYAEQSVAHIFGDALGDPTADELLRELRRLTGDAMRDLFGRHKTSEQIGRALAVLADLDLVAS